MGTDLASPLRPSVFEEAAQWFRRARASLLEAIPCGQGCCACCVGIFPITRLDAQELRRGLHALSPTQKDTIITRAAGQVGLIEASHPRLRLTPCLDEWADTTIDAMVEQFAHLPCPALGNDGSCQIYAFRPITCRTMGIPGESDGLVHGACTIQTAVPIIRLSSSLRTDFDRLAEDEAVSLSILHQAQPKAGNELLLPYGFL